MRGILLLALLLSLTMPSFVGAEGHTTRSVVLTDERDEYPLGLYLEILQDPSRQLTLAQVTAPEFEGRFAPSQEAVPNLGYTNAACWVRFRLRNETRHTEDWDLELGFANMQHVSLYLPRTGTAATAGGSAPLSPTAQGFEARETGTLFPFASRDIPYHKFVFRVSLEPGTERTVYLRFQNEAAMTLPLTLWSTDAFARHSRGEMLFFGLFFGTLLIMLGYNLFLGLTMRATHFIYYALFVGAALMHQLSLNGFAGQFLWPNLPWLNRYAVPFWIVWAIVFSLIFGACFLETRVRAPRQHRAIRLLLAVWGLVLVQVPFAPYRFVVQEGNVLAMVSDVFLTIVAFTAWRRKHQPARYYLLSWVAFSTLLVVVVLVRMGVVPSTPLTEYGYQVGGMMQVLLMSLALADQLNSIKRERIAVQAQALAASREKEALIREQNLQLEAKVAERTAALRESEERFRTLVESSVEGILVHRSFKPLFVNPAYVCILGYQSADQLLETDSVVSWIAPHDRERLLGYHAARIRGEPAPIQYEYDAVRRDGSMITLQQLVTTMPWDGQPAVLAAIVDVTERKRAEEQLQRQAAELERSNQDLEHFAYVVSHDLQEPLRMVIGYLELLQHDSSQRLTGEAGEFVDIAIQAARRMVAMIKALLDLSRVGTHGQPLVPVDCENLLERVLDVLERAIQNSGAVVTHDPLPTLPADESQLAQVLQNLIANAVKFCRPGVPPRVHVGVERQGHEWRFSVRDNGIGLDPRQATRLFQIFSRLHGRDEYPGLGLGLALCRRIVERHGGRIWVESEPGQGAAFYFTLPG